MEKRIQYLIFGIILLVIIGGLYYFLVFNKRTNFPNRNNFQIDEATKNQINTFFDSTTDISQIKDYCNQNRMNCMYYCRDINPNHEICSQLRPAGNRTGPPGGNRTIPMGNRTRNGNWSNER